MITTEFVLRKSFLDYRNRHQNTLDGVLREWNQKVSLGVPIPKEAWNDLFGSRVKRSITDETVAYEDNDDYQFQIVIGLVYNPTNPLHCEMGYKVMGNIKGEEFDGFFSFGEEESILNAYNEVKGAASTWK